MPRSGYKESADRIIGRLRAWASSIRRDVYALYLAGRDPRVPGYAKLVAVCVAGYALSPIDLIPDFIPVLGLLDDLIIVPLGIWFAVRMIPEEVFAELRVAAEQVAGRSSIAAAVVIAFIWLLAMVLTGCWIAGHFQNSP